MMGVGAQKSLRVECLVLDIILGGLFGPFAFGLGRLYGFRGWALGVGFSDLVIVFQGLRHF